MIGIYRIANKVTARVYIGSSAKDLWGRIRAHRKDLNQGKHSNHQLLKDWQVYGSDVFVFEVVEEMPRGATREQVLTREQFYIDSSRCLDSRWGYNLAPKAGSRLGSKQSPEWVAALRERMKGHPVSDATRALLRAAAQRPNHHMPKTRLAEPEIAAKVVATRRARNNYYLTPEQQKAFDRTGTKHSAETLRKKSEAMKILRASKPITEEHRTALVEGGKASRFQPEQVPWNKGRLKE